MPSVPIIIRYSALAKYCLLATYAAMVLDTPPSRRKPKNCHTLHVEFFRRIFVAWRWFLLHSAIPNTEEGFHTNICRSRNCYYVIDTIVQLIDWTFLLTIENQYAEDNRLIVVIDQIVHPYTRTRLLIVKLNSCILTWWCDPHKISKCVSSFRDLFLNSHRIFRQGYIVLKVHNEYNSGHTAAITGWGLDSQCCNVVAGVGQRCYISQIWELMKKANHTKLICNNSQTYIYMQLFNSEIYYCAYTNLIFKYCLYLIKYIFSVAFSTNCHIRWKEEDSVSCSVLERARADVCRTPGVIW